MFLEYINQNILINALNKVNSKSSKEQSKQRSHDYSSSEVEENSEINKQVDPLLESDYINDKEKKLLKEDHSYHYEL